MHGVRLIGLIAALEVIQVFFAWLYVRSRYGLSLRQLARLTTQLAKGETPPSYYIRGSRALEEVSRNLEQVGELLNQLQRDRQKEDLDLLLANMVEGVLVVDSRHVVQLVNAELLKLFDLKQSPLQRTVLESFREARVDQVIRETLDSGMARREEVALESSAGADASRYFECSAVPIRNAVGVVDRAVVVFHDITRIKRLEMVRREFVANVSHELRTPLAIFRGYLETLIDQPKLPREELARALDSMQRNANRLHSLVEDLLVLTKLESGRLEAQYQSIQLDSFFQQIIRDWEKRTQADHAEIHWESPGELPSLDVDLLRFEQVILNLLENAVAYTNAPREITISARKDNAFIEIRVADNGIGIPPADVPHIFERFYRVDKGRSRRSGGSGLGLSICKQIIEGHGGTIRAESEFGSGTTIVLRLPLIRASASASQFLPALKTGPVPRST